MNLLLLHPKQLLDKQTAVLSDRQAEHLAKVLKAQHGQILKVGVLNGNIGRGTLDTSSQPWRLCIQSLDTPPPSRLPVTLLLALPRPQMIKRIMQTAATMGVEQVYLLQTERVEKSFWQSPNVTESSLEQHLILGAEQGVDTHLPTLHRAPRFWQFIDSTLPEISEQKTCLFAHPETEQTAPQLRQHEPSLVAIGPEGGFTDKETDILRQFGFSGFHLGQRILKVETAVPVVLTQLYSQTLFR